MMAIMSRMFKQLPWVLLIIVLVGLKVWEETRYAPVTPSPEPSAGWVTLTEPRWQPDGYNDGDSFKIAHADGVQELRLYFVDCPEKRLHQYNEERLEDQGRDFGGLSVEQMIEIGERGRDFTEALLTSRPFEVHTRWEPVFKSQRRYVMVRVTEADGQQRFLCEILVREGLARIHTQGVDLPDGTKRAAFEKHLREVEKVAKAERRGAWGLSK